MRKPQALLTSVRKVREAVRVRAVHEVEKVNRNLRQQDVASRVHDVLKAYLPGRAALVVGVSGGADSMALLHALCQAGPEVSRRITAVHVNHGLRGSAAAKREQSAVEALCRNLKVPCRVYAPKVRAYQLKHKVSLEDAARKLRQACFIRTARDLRAQAVLTAHHRDDQVETLLLNLMRGAAGKGLGGMLSVRAFPHPDAPAKLMLVRPCLDLSKRALLSYARKHHLSWQEDASNQDTAFTRNRIRRQLIPYLEKKFNPEVGSALARTATCTARDEVFLEALAKKAEAALGVEKAKDGVRVDRKKFRHLDPALRFRVLSRLWDQLKIPGKTFQQLAALEATALSGAGQSRWDLPGNWRVDVTEPVLGFFRTKPLKKTKNSSALNLKPALGVQLRTYKRSEPETWPAPGSPYALMDADKIRQPLKMRPRQEGDRMRPLGLGGRSKPLKKILAEMKVPLIQRKSWPVVVMGTEIVWVFSGPVAEGVKVDETTRRLLRISLNIKRKK